MTLGSLDEPMHVWISQGWFLKESTLTPSITNSQINYLFPTLEHYSFDDTQIGQSSILVKLDIYIMPLTFALPIL